MTLLNCVTLKLTDMNNQEKAIEIANEFADKNVRPAIRIAAEEMAKWKDQQADLLAQVAYESGYDKARQEMKEYLEKKKADSSIDLEPASEIITEIINELFNAD